MKVYIVIEPSCQNIVRFATLRKDIADDIVKSFSWLGLEIVEMNLIGTCVPC